MAAPANGSRRRRFGIEPDTITTAKALTSGYQPLSALLVGDRIAATLVEKGGEFYHGYTYSGHPVACAVALKNLEIIEREGLVDRVRNDTGPYFAQALQERIAGHELVGEVRSIGLMGAIEIVKDKATKERFLPAGQAAVIVRDHAIANGMMLRATGDTMILSPPLIWTRETIDMACERIATALDLAQADLRKQVGENDRRALLRSGASGLECNLRGEYEGTNSPRRA